MTAELDGADCTALAVTPGGQRSEAMLEIFGVAEASWRDAIATETHFCVPESPTFVACGVAALAADPDSARFGGRDLSIADLARTCGVTEVNGSQPDRWRHVVEIQDRGGPANQGRYRWPAGDLAPGRSRVVAGWSGQRGGFRRRERERQPGGEHMSEREGGCGTSPVWALDAIGCPR